MSKAHAVPPPWRERAEGSLPATIAALVGEVENLGGEAWIAGPGLYRLIAGKPAVAWEVHTNARPTALLERWPRAVVTAPGAARITLCDASAPVDLLTFTDPAAIEAYAARRTFSLDSLGLRPTTGDWRVTVRAAQDIAARQLGPGPEAAAAFGRDPLEILRAAHRVAELDLEAAADLRELLEAAAPALDSSPAFEVRVQLRALLGLSSPLRGISLLREIGAEALWLPNAQAAAGAWIEKLPPHEALRFAAWLRGTPAESILSRLRFGRDFRLSVQRLLRDHPLESLVAAPSIRLPRGFDLAHLEALSTLRQAEIESKESASLAEREAFESATRQLREALRQRDEPGIELALDGAAVMHQLACGPGPEVGRALRFLERCVRDDPTCNEAATLGDRLALWAREQAE
mgnify:CR=1 FL=1|jgi:hypothetical protein